MLLTAGTTLGPYEVTAKIGEGGMGEVYRARDTKLDRDVALKVLPPAFTDDPDRLARFEREAKVLASLNHPNIGYIHGLEESEGVKALVLEYIEGSTLADRIKQGPIPVDEALPIAKQIAEALEAAHEQGIIHRDLKPANIKVKSDGTVKVLDFGLAKVAQPVPEGDPSQSPTIAASSTAMGVVLGTAAYMAPEQAGGKPVDKRADVWAFGVVVYEMLTGVRPFVGDDVSKTLARVIDREPDWSALPSDVPPVFQQFLRGCLVKHPAKRVRDVGDVRLAMDGLFDVPSSVGPDAHRARPWRAALPMTLCAMALTSFVTVVVTQWVSRPNPSRSSRFADVLPVPTRFDRGPRLIEISPDGRTIVIAGQDQLHRRDLSQTDWQPIPGTENARNPSFSGDGQWLAFEDGVNLMRVALTGGLATVVAEGVTRSSSWAANDTILFGRRRTGLFRAATVGGVADAVTIAEEGLQGHVVGDVLSSGEAAPMMVTGFSRDTDQLEAVILESGERYSLLQGSDPRYLPTGHIVFVRGGALWAAPFDAERFQVVGSPVPVLEDLRVERNSGVAQAAVSDTGTLVYLPDDAAGGGASSLVFVDREGQSALAIEGEAYYRGPRFSPDGGRLAVVSGQENVDEEIWIWDVQRGGRQRLTTGERNLYPVWSPDGTQVAFSDTATGHILFRAADAATQTGVLLEHEIPAFPGSWSPDGALAFWEVDSGADRDIWVRPPDGEAQEIVASAFNDRSPRFSPDGRWLAYVSDDSGRNEVYIQGYPESDRRHLISTDGGTEPVWSPDGRQIFFRPLDGDGLMVAELDTQARFTASIPELLFRGAYVMDPDAIGFANYDVSPQGDRFVMVDLVRDPDAGEVPLPTLKVVVNWHQELLERVPVN